MQMCDHWSIDMTNSKWFFSSNKQKCYLLNFWVLFFAPKLVRKIQYPPILPYLRSQKAWKNKDGFLYLYVEPLIEFALSLFCRWCFVLKRHWGGQGFSPLLWLRTTACDQKNWGGRGFSPLLWARTTGEKRRLNAGNPPLPLPTLCSSSVLCVLLFSIIMTLTMDSLSHKSILRPTSISCCCWLAKLSLTNSLASSFKIYILLTPNCILLKTLYNIVVSSLKANCFQENYKFGFSAFSKIFHQLFITFKNSWVMMLFSALPKT